MSISIFYYCLTDFTTLGMGGGGQKMIQKPLPLGLFLQLPLARRDKVIINRPNYIRIITSLSLCNCSVVCRMSNQ